MAEASKPDPQRSAARDAGDVAPMDTVEIVQVNCNLRIVDEESGGVPVSGVTLTLAVDTRTRYPVAVHLSPSSGHDSVGGTLE